MADPIVRQSGGPVAESVSLEELVVCALKNQEFTARDVVEAALFRGDLDPLWQNFLYRMAADKYAEDNELELDEDLIDSAAEQFRYAHDLITAEETEQWLASRGLSLDDFGSYFARQVAGETVGSEAKPESIEYRTASDELRQLFMGDLILSDQLERLTNDFSWRLAALAADEGTPRAEKEPIVAAQGKAFLKRMNLKESEVADWLASLRRDRAWLDQMLQMEAEFQQRHNVVLTAQARQREMNLLRLPLTRFEAEVIEVESRDAAQEALFCVKQDGMSMEEVAAEGRYPFKVISFLQEDIPAELQQKFLSVLPGEVLEPVARGDGYEVYRVTEKREPQGDDETVRQRIDHLLLSRHFSELTGRHVQNRLFMNMAKE